MRILIADDEKLVRFSVRSILEEILESEERVFPISIEEADTGTSMVEKIDSFRPHIAFVDIRMPGMTGLEAIEKCISGHPDIKWIILSGYSEFEYARKALTLKVLDYMLKPVDPLEVKAVLEKAAAELKEEQVVRNSVFEKKMFSIINDLSSPEFDPFFSEPVCYQAFLVEFNSNSEEEEVTIRKKTAGELAERWSAGFHDFLSAFVTLENGSSAVILRIRMEENTADAEIRYLGERFPKLGFYTTGIHRSVEGLLEELMTITEDLKSDEAAAESEPGHSALPILVRRTVEYAREHFQEPIGVAQAADYLGVTPNYLSAVFKRDRGVSFTSFITEIRMKKAPDLLSRPGATVKETSSSLGYQSSRHFARLFREHYNCTPTGYQNRR